MDKRYLFFSAPKKFCNLSEFSKYNGKVFLDKSTPSAIEKIHYVFYTKHDIL
jgi:hypothetical protein